jgi:predicted GH43/DUF377 family glycosyl hydrolase
MKVGALHHIPDELLGRSCKSFGTRCILPMVCWTACAVFLSMSDTRAQFTWTRDSLNPVLSVWSGGVGEPSAYQYVYQPAVLYDSVKQMYLMVFSSRSWGASVLSGAVAMSANGRDWFPYSKNPVLNPGIPGEFDSRWVVPASLVYDGREYKLYYTGYNDTVWRPGVATSPDGVRWSKYAGNPVLTVTPNSWESKGVSTPKVHFDGMRYTMHYCGYDGSQYEIGMATSPDGFRWTKHFGNPVFARGTPGAWDEKSVVTAGIFIYHGTYFMMYSAGPLTAMGIAISGDGISWSRYQGNPVFFPGAGDSWESRIEYGSMLLRGNTVHLWYSGYGPSSGGFNAWQVGHATAPFVASAGSKTPKMVPDDFILYEPRPNLHDAHTVIQFFAPKTAHVSLTIFDLGGNEVTTLQDGTTRPGLQTVRWDTRGYVAGVYLCKLVAGDSVRSVKVAVVR